MTNVTIVGAGLMGTATAWPLVDNWTTTDLVVPKLTERNILRPDELPLIQTLIDSLVHRRPAALPFD